MIELILPYPPSLNAYRRVSPQGFTYPTAEAKRYKLDAGWIAKKLGFRQPVAHPVRLEITLCHRALNKNGRKNGAVMDLDNCLKVALDSLKGIVYDDDRQVKSITLDYGSPTNAGALIIKLSRFTPIGETYAALDESGENDDHLPAGEELRPGLGSATIRAIEAFPDERIIADQHEGMEKNGTAGRIQGGPGKPAPARKGKRPADKPRSCEPCWPGDGVPF